MVVLMELSDQNWMKIKQNYDRKKKSINLSGNSVMGSIAEPTGFWGVGGGGGG